MKHESYHLHRSPNGKQYDVVTAAIPGKVSISISFILKRGAAASPNLGTDLNLRLPDVDPVTLIDWYCSDYDYWSTEACLQHLDLSYLSDAEMTVLDEVLDFAASTNEEVLGAATDLDDQLDILHDLMKRLENVRLFVVPGDTHE